MELYAAGFNAWGQLAFEEVPDDVEPEDIFTFECLIRAKEKIRILRTVSTVSSIVVLCDDQCRISGKLGYLAEPEASVEEEARLMQTSDLVMAGNGKLIDLEMNEYSSFDVYYSQRQPSKIWSGPAAAQIAAGQTHFVALIDGKVYTWGDTRYLGCLGRELDQADGGSTFECTPAHIPGLVTDLVDLPTGPVTKVVAGGFLSAALTAGNDVYIWGAMTGHNQVLDDLSGSPTPLDVFGLDIMDIGIGDRHIIVLTANKQVLVIGEGSNGQLGLGKLTEVTTRISQWKEVKLNLGPGREVVSVEARQNASFLIVQKDMSLEDHLLE